MICCFGRKAGAVIYNGLKNRMLMWNFKRCFCIVLLFSMSMYVLAVSNDSSQVKTTETAMVVSLVTSIVALIGTFVTYWKFRLFDVQLHQT